MTNQSPTTLKLLPTSKKRAKLSVRGRFFATMITMIVLIESLSGLIFHRHLSDWLYQETLDQSIIATESIAKQLSEEFVTELGWSLPLSTINTNLARRLNWLSHIAKSSDVRLSLLSLEGELLLDTGLSSAQISQSNRSEQKSKLNKTPEVRDALKGVLGISRRYSTAMEQDLIYVASLIKDKHGKAIALIRLAKSSNILDQQLNHLGQVLLVILAFSLAIALLVSGWAASMLSETLQRLVSLARDLSRDHTNKAIDFDYQNGRDEYSKLARSLTSLASQIEDQVARLADSRNRFEAVLDSMREGVIALDEEYRISLVNKSACRLLAWSSPPLNRHIDNCVNEEALLLFLHGQAAAEAPWVELEFKGRRTVLARLTPQSNRGESVLVLNDITALRRLETVRRDFVANVSHELRTPTTVIRANAETLLDGAMNEPLIAKNFLEGIERNAQRLSHLVSDLLDLSRIESGTYQMSEEQVEPAQIVTRVVDTLADQLVKKQIKVIIEVEDHLSLINDAGAVEQVFTNLIENAVNYTAERGSVTIKAIPDLNRSEWLRFEVIDDGPGISAKHQKRIFERFYRVDKGRSRQLGGTGLGLAIVKHLCQGMGGNVGVESETGQGCTFWFSLPKKAPHSSS